MRCKARVVRVEITGSPECSFAMSFISAREMLESPSTVTSPTRARVPGDDLKSYVDLMLLFVALL